ncbi:MAG: hypothetical protein WBV94_12780 [Blastocatellia bacterium]
MNEGHQKSGYSWYSDEIAELSAWQGYEFWSAQLETEMEFSADFEQSGSLPQSEGFALSRLEMKEGKSDVLPF